MFFEVFLKIFLAIFGKVLIFNVFRAESFFEVFFWKSGTWDLWGILGVFLFGLPFPWFPIRVSIHLRLASDDSPLVLRSIFDRSSIPERRMNEEWTKNERRMNEGWTELERRINGGWTELERSSNGGWTELERSSNGGWTELERSPNGAWTEPERSSNGGWTEVERRLNGARTEDERRMNGGWTRTEREPNEGWTRTIQKIYHRNCWLDCDAVSLLMIFQELIKVDFGMFLLDDDLYNTLQNIRHIKSLLPNAEHCQTCCLEIISFQPHENQA